MDWMVDRWVDIDAKPDVLSAISSFSPGPKLSPCSTFSKVAESGSSVMSDRDTVPIKANATDEDKKITASLGNMADELIGNMNMANPGKRLKLTDNDDGGGEGDVH